jgi:hypothetical protein
MVKSVPAPQLTEKDREVALNEVVIAEPISPVPPAERIDMSKEFSLPDVALSINALYDAHDHNARILSHALRHLYTELGVAIPTPPES